MDQSGAPAANTGFEFTGRPGEYFRIWIVNVFLTVITLGIYSAWAKVRRNRYLYASTRLGGAPFEYLADPVQILKGRLLAIALFAVYSVSGHFLPVLQGVLVLVFLAFLPWLVNRARNFALQNTAYRNIRFRFTAQYGEAAGIFILWPILMALSIFLLYPFYVWRRAKYIVDNSAFGSHSFAFTATKGGFFLIYLKFVLLVIAVFVAGGASAAMALGLPEPVSIVAAALAVVVALLALLAVLSYVHVAVTNRIWSNVEIGGMSTRCQLATPRMYWIALSSLIAIVLTFGLLIPWATIRMTRYRVERLSLENAEQLPALVGAQSEKIGAAGEELSDLLGIDIAL